MSTWPAQPLLLQDSDDVVVDGWGVAVLVVRGATGITEYYAVVGRVDVSVACLALGGEQRLGRLAPLDAWRGLWQGRDEGDGLVYTAAGLGVGGQWGVRVGDVRVLVVVVVVVLQCVRRRLPSHASPTDIVLLVCLGALPLAATAASPSSSAPSPSPAPTSSARAPS